MPTQYRYVIPLHTIFNFSGTEMRTSIVRLCPKIVRFGCFPDKMRAECLKEIKVICNEMLYAESQNLDLVKWEMRT